MYHIKHFCNSTPSSERYPKEYIEVLVPPINFQEVAMMNELLFESGLEELKFCDYSKLITKRPPLSDHGKIKIIVVLAILFEFQDFWREGGGIFCNNGNWYKPNISSN